MQQRKPTKKHHRQVKRVRLFISFLILVFLSLVLFLSYKIVFFKKTTFISPISNIGYKSNNEFEAKLKKEKIEYSNFKVVGDIYQFDIKDQGTVTMDPKSDHLKQISSLQLILRSLKIEGKRFKSLDFRYGNPVIVF